MNYVVVTFYRPLDRSTRPVVNVFGPMSKKEAVKTRKQFLKEVYVPEDREFVVKTRKLIND